VAVVPAEALGAAGEAGVALAVFPAEGLEAAGEAGVALAVFPAEALEGAGEAGATAAAVPAACDLPKIADTMLPKMLITFSCFVRPLPTNDHEPRRLRWQAPHSQGLHGTGDLVGSSPRRDFIRAMVASEAIGLTIPLRLLVAADEVLE
jgi:hypothetical protein